LCFEHEKGADALDFEISNATAPLSGSSLALIIQSLLPLGEVTGLQ
jgi:hypothetical protein